MHSVNTGHSFITFLMVILSNLKARPCWYKQFTKNLVLYQYTLFDLSRFSHSDRGSSDVKTYVTSAHSILYRNTFSVWYVINVLPDWGTHTPVVNTKASITFSDTAYTVTERCSVDDMTCIIPESKCGMNVSCDCFGECFMTDASTCQQGTVNRQMFAVHLIPHCSRSISPPRNLNHKGISCITIIAFIWFNLLIHLSSFYKHSVSNI